MMIPAGGWCLTRHTIALIKHAATRPNDSGSNGSSPGLDESECDGHAAPVTSATLHRNHPPAHLSISI